MIDPEALFVFLCLFIVAWIGATIYVGGKIDRAAHSDTFAARFTTRVDALLARLRARSGRHSS